MSREVLQKLTGYKTLERAESYALMMEMAKGNVNSSQVASILSVFMMRPVCVEEMEGFREALLELCNYVPLEEYSPIDLCGTGGDGKDTFNISTLASFVVAGAGVNVAKHGNYGVSSVSGSSNMLEYFGYKFKTDHGSLKKEIEKTGICFLHAPLFHPALKHVSEVRKMLGVKTIFNMLGPLVNPAKVKYQAVGVFSLELARIYSYLMQNSDSQYFILHSLDGYDEISLTGKTKILSRSREILVDATSFGVHEIKSEEINGGNTVKEMAEIFISVLQGRGTAAQNHVVCANAAVGIQCVKAGSDLKECFLQAEESLLSGKALEKFKQLMELQ